MYDYWQHCKLRYLRNNDRLDFESMRRFNLPNNMIKQILLDELKAESEFFFN